MSGRGKTDATDAPASTRAEGGRFRKGVSGNPGGRNAELKPVRDLARLHTEAAVEALVDIMINPKAAAVARVSAATALLDRGWGRPTQAVEIDAKVTDRHEYDITQRIIHDPATANLASELLGRVARGDAGLVRIDGERGSMADGASPR